MAVHRAVSNHSNKQHSSPDSSEPFLSISDLCLLALPGGPAESEESPEVKPEEAPVLVLRAEDTGALLEVDWEEGHINCGITFV